MIIRRLETYTQKHLSLVKVITDEGAQGIGQISPYDADISALVFHRLVAPVALGKDPMDLDMLVDRIMVETFKYPGSFVCRALAGLDTAIWDLRGKLEGKSVCELLGGTPCALTPYGSSMSREITPTKEAERLVRLRCDFGYRSFKIRIGKENGHDEDEWPGRTEELVPTARRALGDDIDLKVDANSCYTPLKAIKVSKLLEDNGISHFEEPCPYWELEWTAETAAALDIHVAGGEQDVDDFEVNDNASQISISEWQTAGHGRQDGQYASGNNAAKLDCEACHDTNVGHGVPQNLFRLHNANNTVCLSCHGDDDPNTGKDVDESHYGNKHDAASDGGNFCWDCHDPPEENH